MSKLSALTVLRTEFGSLIGDTRIRLLEEIGRHGSIAKAARQVPLSYKTAWDAVDEMNNLADHALVSRSVGGAQGGGTQLTPHGQQLIALFRALEVESQSVVDRLSLLAEDELPANPVDIQRLLRRMAVRTSARNQFACTVAAVREGEVDAQVVLALDTAHQLEATVTRDSVSRLGIAPGLEVLALVKAPALLLLPGQGLRSSAGNHLEGVVSRVHEGTVNTEVMVGLVGASTKQLCAVITTESLRALKFAAGSPVVVAFQASSVTLAVMH